MEKLTRRRLMRSGAALGLAGVIPQSAENVAAQTSSTDLEKFVQALPIPSVLEPDGQRDGADTYELSQTEFTQKLHPDLPETTLWGFEGSYPGPMIEAEKGQPIHVRFDNSALPSDHLFDVDESISGTTTENYDYDGFDGPVPEVRTVTHFHGLEVAPENDGQSDMWTSPDGETGPRFSNHRQELPMEQDRTTSTYHDHTIGITRLNAYAGLLGLFSITTQEERDLGLPSGEYDIPLLLQDKSFNSDGSLSYPSDWTTAFVGDTAVINGAVWPSLEVEPRRYRFRLLNGANHRSFDIQLSNDGGTGVPTMYQFAPDHGFLDSVVPVGSGGDLSSLRIGPFERAEIIVDFSDYAGETFTVTNSALMGAGLNELFQISVTDPTTPPMDDSADPTQLPLPSTGPEFDENEVVETRQIDLGLEVRDGVPTFTLNGHVMWEDGSMVYPKLGDTEIWEFRNNTSGTHPMHMHLVTFEVIGRGPDGTETPLPNERGHKDVVRVRPDETVRVLTRFDGFTGQFPYHCHMLEHEDNKMMVSFYVENSPRSYVNDGDDVIEVSGLTDAMEDWRNGNLDIEDLLEVIDYWRSGNPVQ